jgi:hypothetical protein
MNNRGKSTREVVAQIITKNKKRSMLFLDPQRGNTSTTSRPTNIWREREKQEKRNQFVLDRSDNFHLNLSSTICVVLGGIVDSQ